MKCNNCGRQWKDEASYCNACGCKLIDSPGPSNTIIPTDTEVGFSRSDSDYIKPAVILHQGEDTVPPEPETGLSEASKSIKQIRLRHLILPLLLFLLILGSIFYLNRTGNTTSAFTHVSKEVLEIYSLDANRETYVFNTKGELLHTIPGMYFPFYCEDKTAAILSGSNEELIYVNAKEQIQLASHSFNLNMSANGKFLIYTQGDATSGYKLCLYDVDKKKESILDTNPENNYGVLTVSKDGQQITYSKIKYDITNNQTPILEAEAYVVQNGGIPEFIGRNILIAKVVKATGCIYYYAYEGSSLQYFYVQKDGRAIKLIDDVKTSNKNFTENYSEFLFSENGNTYISIHGRGRELVAKTHLDRIITPIGTRTHTDLLAGGFHLYGLKTFKNKVFLDQNQSIWFVNEQYQANKIGDTNKGKSIYLSKDGNSVLYTNIFKEVILVQDLKGDGQSETVMDRVDYFIASDDMAEIYYIQDNDLYYKGKGKEPVLIRTNASGLTWNTDRTVALFQAGYSSIPYLYYSRHGGEAEPVPNNKESVVLEQGNYGKAYLNITSDGIQLYYNTSGSEMKMILKTKRE